MSARSLAPNTIKVYQLTGQTEFIVPFEYLARKFVVLTLLGVDRKILTLNVDYRFVTKTKISLTKPTTAGYDKLEIRRETLATERLVDFHDGSILRSYDLNLSQVQTLHVAEEARDLTADTIGVNDDGALDARGRKIVNLGNGRRGSHDAANMLQLAEYDTSTLNNADRAEAMKDLAEALASQANEHRKAAQVSETKAKTSETNSKTSETKAKTSETNADASWKKIVPLEASTVKNAKDADEDAKTARKAADEALAVSASIGALPTGSVCIFVTNPLPAGFLALNGDSFDIKAYPALGRLFPDGRLPDFRDRYPKMTGAEINLLAKKGWVVGQHSHNLRGNAHVSSFDYGSKTASTFDYGTKTSNTTGDHRHTTTVMDGWNEGAGVGYFTGRSNATGGRGNVNVGAAGNHNHTVAIGSHNHSVSIGSHTHTLSGTTDNNNLEKNEVDRIGVIYAIKAAGNATNEDFINVSQYEERLRKLENDVSSIITKLANIESTTKHMKVITIPNTSKPTWYYLGTLKGSLLSSMQHGCTITGSFSAGKNGVTASGAASTQHVSFVATVGGGNGASNTFVNSCLQIFVGSKGSHLSSGLQGIATTYSTDKIRTYLYVKVGGYTGASNSAKLLVTGDWDVISELRETAVVESSLINRCMGRVYVFKSQEDFASTV